MARKRITKKGDNVKNESPLRKLWYQQGQCAMAVRLHLMRMEDKGIRVQI